MTDADSTGTVEVVVRPAPAAAGSIDGDWAAEVAAEVAGTMAALGLPGSPRVTVADPLDLPPGLLASVTVGGRRCRFPVAMVHAVFGSLLDGPLPPMADDELEQRVLSSGVAPAVLRETAVEAIRRSPSVLLTPAAVARVGDALSGMDATAAGRWPADRLARVLRGVLDLRLSLADAERVAGALVGASGSVLGARESVAAAVRTDVIGIHLRRRLLRDITTDLGAENADILNTLRDEIFDDLGIWLPEFRLVTDESLAPDAIRLTINSLPTIAYRPHTGATGAQHLVNAIATAVHQFCWCMLDQAGFAAITEQLARIYPALTTTARELLPAATMTAVLRGLLAEGVSIRNMRRILERAVDSTDSFLAPPPERLDQPSGHPAYAGDTDACALTEYVRVGLRWQIRQQAGSGGTVVGYLVDPAIESALAETPRDERLPDRVIAAVLRETGGRAAAPPEAVILTAPASRAALWDLIRAELPMPVLTYEELPPATPIQALARIKLD